MAVSTETKAIGAGAVVLIAGVLGLAWLANNQLNRIHLPNLPSLPGWPDFKVPNPISVGGNVSYAIFRGVVPWTLPSDRIANDPHRLTYTDAPIDDTGLPIRRVMDLGVLPKQGYSDVYGNPIIGPINYPVNGLYTQINNAGPSLEIIPPFNPTFYDPAWRGKVSF